MIFETITKMPTQGTVKNKELVRPLQTKYRKNGYDYTIASRGKISAIYCQQVTEKVKYFEVFRIRVAPRCEIKGNIIEAHEKFPGNEDFGKWAWSINSYDKAMLKFKEFEDEG